MCTKWPFFHLTCWNKAPSLRINPSLSGKTQVPARQSWHGNGSTTIGQTSTKTAAETRTERAGYAKIALGAGYALCSWEIGTSRTPATSVLICRHPFRPVRHGRFWRYRQVLKDACRPKQRVRSCVTTSTSPKLRTVVSSLHEVRIQADSLAKVVQRLIALALVPGPNSTIKRLDGAFRMFVSKRSRRTPPRERLTMFVD